MCVSARETHTIRKTLSLSLSLIFRAWKIVSAITNHHRDPVKISLTASRREKISSLLIISQENEGGGERGKKWKRIVWSHLKIFPRLLCQNDDYLVCCIIIIIIAKTIMRKVIGCLCCVCWIVYCRRLCYPRRL